MVVWVKMSPGYNNNHEVKVEALSLEHQHVSFWATC